MLQEAKRIIALSLSAAWLLFGGCGYFEAALAQDSPAEIDVSFVDVTRSAGITWVHDNGMTPERLLPETMIGGAAFLDYNNDGWLDLYFVTGSSCDFYKPKQPVTNALYRNNRDGTFTDVTVEAGVPGRGFGSGITVADYDNDGWQDLLVTGVRSVILYRNRGDGTFEEVTQAAGLEAKGWSASAAFFDFDRDGYLDLWICGYVIWEPELNHRCGGGETPRYCIPTLFDPWPSRLFRNLGDGTFENISERSGAGDPRSKGLGVVTADINNDGWPDIFQSNDTTENFLFINRGDGTLEEIGLLASVAFSYDGRARSGMGVDAQDFDDDGRIDLLVANIDHEDVSIYRNIDGESFDDVVVNTPAVIQATRYMSTFAVKFVDFDNDGDEDIVALNGHPDDQIDLHRGNIHYRDIPLLFENTDGRYENITARGGPAFKNAYPGRGLAIGDYDNDGDTDLLFLNNGDTPALIRNDGGNRNNWLGIRLRGTRSNRDGIGTCFDYQVEGKKRIHCIAGGSSYQSSHDRRVILGFGRQKETGWIRIRWPSGQVDEIEDVSMNRYMEVVEGSTSPNDRH